MTVVLLSIGAFALWVLASLFVYRAVDGAITAVHRFRARRNETR